MPFYGRPNELYATILFMIFAVMAGILCIIQLIFLQKLNIWAIYWLPLLSFCICYENIILYLGDSISPHSAIAYAGNVLHALEIPIFIIVLYEVSFRLHEARSAQFLYFIRFDLGTSAAHFAAILSLLIVRVVAAGMFVMTFITDFIILRKTQRSYDTGIGGYEAFIRGNNDRSVSLWINLIPPMVLTAAGLTIGVVLYRYGHNMTIGIRYTRRWRSILIAAICQAVGQCFWVALYPVTSNAGELALLIGCSVMVWTVQDDLTLAGTFADFLHSSNVAFQSSIAAAENTPSPPLPLPPDQIPAATSGGHAVEAEHTGGGELSLSSVSGAKEKGDKVHRDHSDDIRATKTSVGVPVRQAAPAATSYNAPSEEDEEGSEEADFEEGRASSALSPSSPASAGDITVRFDEVYGSRFGGASPPLRYYVARTDFSSTASTATAAGRVGGGDKR